MTVPVRGVDLAVQEAGVGTPVLWGHGLTNSMASEDRIGLMTPQLPIDEYRLVRYDARGHGRSEATLDPDAFAYPELARDQLALADALGLDRFVSGGASLGTGTSLHVAVQAPERVLALLLVIPPTGWEGRAARGGWYQSAGRLVTEEGIEALIAEAEAQPQPAVFAPFADQLKAAIRERYESYDPEVLSAVLRGVGASDLPTRDEIATITAPTLILAWEGDPVHPESTAKELVELIPGAELHLAPSLREVATWSDLMLDFLERSRPR